MGEYLSQWMLVSKRDFVIKCKAVLRKVVIWFASKLPDPTKENTLEPNSHILLAIRDKFFGYYNNKGREDMFRAAWKVLICEYEHDPHYRHILDWLIEEVVESVMSGEWKPRPSRHPSGFWNEPRTPDGDYGNYHGRQFAKLIKK